MPKYIEREAVLGCFHDWVDRYGDVHSADEMPEFGRIEALPAADVVERKRGAWIVEDKYTDYRTERCSACGFAANRTYIQDFWRFCPHCGADMRPEPPKEGET